MTGTGTIGDPYLISSADDLYGTSGIQSVAASYDYLNPMYCLQTGDIDLGGVWRDPIPVDMNMDYNGGCFRITGFVSNNTGTVRCLFLQVYGRFRNLGLEGIIYGSNCGTFAYNLMSIPIFGGVVCENCYFSGTVGGFNSTGMVGGICCTALAVAGGSSPIFRNVSVRGVVKANGYVGGFVGYGTPIFEGCYSASDLGVTTPGASAYIGGFVGYAETEGITYTGLQSVFNKTYASYDVGFSAGKSATNGRTNAQLMQEDTYTDWDFSTLWNIFEGASYPWIREFTPASANPSAAPASGEYSAGSKSIVLACATVSARIYYTTDGSTPTTASTMAASGSTIDITVPTTLKMLAYAPYGTSSDVVSEIYAQAAAVAAPVCNPPSGEYPGADATGVTVTVTCTTDGATIHYTTDDSTPTTGSSTVANGGTLTRLIGSADPLKLIAVKVGMSDSQVVTVNYTSAPSVATTTFAPIGGSYVGATVPVTLFCSTPGAIIRYVLSASSGAGYSPASPQEPTESDEGVVSGTVVNVPIASTINAKGFKDGMTPASYSHAEYTSKISTPELSPESGGTDASTTPVVVTCPTASVTMHYTLDGSTPDETDPTVAHGATLTVTVPATLSVIAYRTDYATSDVVSGSYTQADARQQVSHTRFVRQVRTDPKALLATAEAAQDALDLLMVEPWIATTSKQATLPARNALLEAASDEWDAYKVVGNYALDAEGKGYQRAYAGMVAYRFKIPADAITNARHILSVDLPLHVDRWLVGGIRLSAVLSDSGYPSTDWDTIRNGDATALAQLPMQYDFSHITDANPQGAILVDKSSTITITFPTTTAAEKYLWVYASIEDYTTVRKFWIEGSGMIGGSGTEIEFDYAVLPDPAVNPTLFLPTAVFDYLAPDEDTIAGVARYADNNAVLSYTHPVASSDLMFSAYFDNAILQSLVASWVAASVATANATYKAVGTTTVEVTAGVLPLILGVTQAGALCELVTHTAIGDYPDWMQIRLNIYAIFDPTEAQKAASTTRAAMITARSAWWAGTYASDGYVNLLSVDLSPDGYPAFSKWRTKDVQIPAGLCSIFITPQITNITGTPAAADTAYGLELAMSAISFKMD